MIISHGYDLTGRAMGEGVITCLPHSKRTPLQLDPLGVELEVKLNKGQTMLELCTQNPS